MEPTVEQRLRQERDLYRSCLDFARADDPAPLLDHALRLLREIVGAQRGYVEVQDLSTIGAERWSASVGVDDEERELIQARISRGVIAAAIATGEVVHTPSALLDERFQGRTSVQTEEIEAVLCVPLFAPGVAGVVYLQNRIGGGPFDAEDLACVDTVARFLGLIAGRLLELLRRRNDVDRTRAVRNALRVDNVVGRSAALATILERLAIVATMESNVLLRGPSGTGKSMFARVLHDNSRRATGPFVELNCAALPTELIESELFGAARGAHSGTAQRGVTGKVAAAERGTLFLDEIGELPLGAQAKLLQLVQEKTYFPLGATQPQRADVRIVTATNRALEEDVEQKRFRDDLYYRIKSVQLAIPSLAARRDDIPALARHFCNESCRRNAIPAMTISAAALAAIEYADWPGNVRQLASACEEAVVNAQLDGVSELDLRHVFPSTGPRAAPETTLHGAREEWERKFIEQALARSDWNVTTTAGVLDLSRSHLNALIRRYGLSRTR